jgi:rhamnosyltransferase
MMSPGMPSVAVLMAAYNGEQWIEEQVKSILCQSNVDVNLFISVDCSDDSTLDICKTFEQANSNVMLLEYGERFGVAAKNFFRLILDIDLTPFDYVALSDQDDIWLPYKLSRAISVLKSTSAGGFSSDALAFWPDGRRQIVKKSYPQKKYDYFFESAGPGCTYCLKSSLIQNFKSFLLEHYSEIYLNASHDWVIYAYARHHGYKWYIDDKPLIEYRQHSSNQTGYNSGISAYFKRINMLKEDWYQRRIRTILYLLDVDSSTGISLKKSYLITHFWQLRRRPRDAFALLFLVLSGLF